MFGCFAAAALARFAARRWPWVTGLAPRLAGRVIPLRRLRHGGLRLASYSSDAHTEPEQALRDLFGRAERGFPRGSGTRKRDQGRTPGHSVLRRFLATFDIGFELLRAANRSSTVCTTLSGEFRTGHLAVQSDLP